MRADSTSAAAGRVAPGWKSCTTTPDCCPGVTEEVVLTLRAGKPVYLLGAFGGATRAVVDVVRGQDRGPVHIRPAPETSSSWQDLRGSESTARVPSRYAGGDGRGTSFSRRRRAGRCVPQRPVRRSERRTGHDHRRMARRGAHPRRPERRGVVPPVTSVDKGQSQPRSRAGRWPSYGCRPPVSRTSASRRNIIRSE